MGVGLGRSRCVLRQPKVEEAGEASEGEGEGEGEGRVGEEVVSESRSSAVRSHSGSSPSPPPAEDSTLGSTLNDETLNDVAPPRPWLSAARAWICPLASTRCAPSSPSESDERVGDKRVGDEPR